MRTRMIHRNFTGQFRRVGQIWSRRPGRGASGQSRNLDKILGTALLQPDSAGHVALPDEYTSKAGAPVITHLTRNMVPYRRFQNFMSALERVQRADTTCLAIIVGADNLSYDQKPQGTTNWWKKIPQKVTLGTSRPRSLGKVPYGIRRKTLQMPAAHAYLTYSFVLSWSMQEDMASGCLIDRADTAPIKEAPEHGRN